MPPLMRSDAMTGLSSILRLTAGCMQTVPLEVPLIGWERWNGGSSILAIWIRSGSHAAVSFSMNLNRRRSSCGMTLMTTRRERLSVKNGPS